MLEISSLKDAVLLVPHHILFNSRKTKQNTEINKRILAEDGGVPKHNEVIVSKVVGMISLLGNI